MKPSYKKIIQKMINTYNQSEVLWKTLDSRHLGQTHLEKRQRRKDIPSDWSLKNYNSLIMDIITNIDNDVHLYSLTMFEKNYFTFDDGTWIVIVGEDGVIETCMIGNPKKYFINNPGYTYLGKVKDVLK